MPRNRIIILLGMLLVVLAACNSQSTEEKMYEHLEEAVSQEDGFAEQQQPLVELEQQEKELYNEIISLGMEEFDQVKELSEEALGLIDKREERLNAEKESIESAKKEFDNVKPLVDELEDDNVQTTAKEMISVMDEREQAYQALNEAYHSALEQDRKLYQMLQQEDLKEDDLRSQIDRINENYDNVIAANETFNEKTEAYNQLKQDFYEQAELNVEYEKQSESESNKQSESENDTQEADQDQESTKDE
ncbi:YkyA family protein [Sediminibacillus halophilus]|uniref:Putative cell-wall binding lipoprotein n=1 Tax=Sediminibacillus halophilus TaxID=482461 RepID=A0A1G9MWS3_9BACI|nr:YkyA family protein [Sediminibacillus halophilus]SDL78710.1 Putative cell-wall binding lipoprotein [Sediminibacillus halophilus]